MVPNMKGALLASVIGAFLAGAFIASPELRAYAANTVGSIDIINNSIQSIDIKDGEVKTADIASGAVQNSDIGTNAVTALKIQEDAVGASEINGITKLIFAETTDGGFVLGPQETYLFGVTVPGAAEEDNVIVTANNAVGLDIVVIGAQVDGGGNVVLIMIKNDGDSTVTVPVRTYSLIIYKIG